MSPDPFRALDRLDPPDQWDEIACRAGSDDVDVDVDLDTVGTLRPRRRAALLVAAAAAAALIAGIAVAGPDDGGDEGVSATDPPATGEAADCPFHLDPAADLPAVIPLPTEQVSEDAVVWRSVPEMGPVSTWGRTRADGTDVLVGVGAPAPEAEATTSLGIAGTSGGRRRADGTRITGATVTVVGSTTLTGPEPCSLVKVFVEVPMLPEDDVEEFVFADLDQAHYLDVARPAIERVRDAVALDAGTGCTVSSPEPAPEWGAEPDVGDNRFGGELRDGRPYEVRTGAEGTEVWIDGRWAAGPARSNGIPVTETGGWLATNGNSGRGLAYGARPPGAVRTYAVTGDGVQVCDRITFSPDGRWFALPDVDRDWTLVHVDADGALVLDLSPAAGCPIDGECPTTETGSTATTEPAASTTTEAVGDPLAGTLADGNGFTVEPDPERGLCATLGTADAYCGGTATSTEDRLVADDCCSPLWFGIVPEHPEGRIVPVLQRRDGTAIAATPVMSGRIWAIPVPVDLAGYGFESTMRVLYRLPDGSLIEAT
jgi:hypothetical protein